MASNIGVSRDGYMGIVHVIPRVLSDLVGLTQKTIDTTSKQNQSHDHSHRALALKDFLDDNKSTYNIILAGSELTKNEKTGATTLKVLRDNPYAPWNIYRGPDI